MWWADFHFIRPLWLLAVIIPLFLASKVWKDEQIQSSWAKVCDEHLLKFLLIKGRSSQRKRPYRLAILICFLAVLALAGPTWKKIEYPALKVNNPIMFALNMSSDMWAKDATPNRGERAKYIIQDLLDLLQTSETGLLVYSREPFVVTPLSEDKAMVGNLLSSVSPDIMPENGDRLDRAINLAVERMQQLGYRRANIIILTADVGERFDAALDAASDAAKSGFIINIVKMSDAANDKLQMIADKGRGILLNYKDSMQLLAEKINDGYAEEVKQSENMQTSWEDFGYFVFWLPALLMLYFFRRGVVLVWLLFLLANPVEAAWFSNRNQEAMQKFNDGEYADAAAKFDDTAWRGAAAYKGGNYAQALRDFSQQQGLDALYNQGNALAKSGKIKEAMAKYEEVLAQDKDFADAKFNLEYLKQQQQNQQQQSQNKQNQQQSKQQNSSEDQQEKQQNKQENAQNQNADKTDKTDEKNDEQQGQNGQEQSDDNQQNNNENKDKAGDDAQQNKSNDTDKKDNNEQNEKQNAQLSQDEGDEQSDASAGIGDEQSPEEQEKARARAQRFREIPEDKGGLLRAFIRKEYERNRYKD